ncbi:TrkH family potassium uptake protein [Alkalilacustris brevis]|uniref:TrkH family potassium uptake protein n=1 Tax=Alkalilacustris brevis TaxID=2026338 RepID=UPI000E0CC6BC|nr:TrkH family potassium uptake protein [Alkalilacustris brevis]
MIDLRPVGYILGLLSAVIGLAMLVPMAADMIDGDANWRAFMASATVTFLAGVFVALACQNGARAEMGTRHAFVLTTGAWVVLPLFGALPFMLGVPGVGFTDAFFESMSGITTTGTTVFVGLDSMPRGTLLWRSILQWLGGLGIIVVAMLFLPLMKVGGMQFYRSEAFDTMGKVMPRALDLARALFEVYLLITVACAASYFALGLSAFDAVNHAFTTVATGGFSTSDASFAAFSPAAQYASILFMILAGLPFVRFVQLMGGSFAPLWQDIQVRAYIRWITYAVAAVLVYRIATEGVAVLPGLRESAFNVVSLFSGTGYSSADVSAWGAFPLVVVIAVGAVGACTASTGCSIKVFRYLVLFEAIKAQIRRIHSPSRVVPVRLDGKPLGDDVINSVIALFTLFMVGFGIAAVLLSLTGLQISTAFTAAWTALFNIGPAFGPEVGPTGAVDGFPPLAKWVMIAAMLAGRLEMLAVVVLLLPRFWRA